MPEPLEHASSPEQLYALPPEQFTAARDAAARQAKANGDPAGAKSLAALRRATVAAWLVNRLAGERTELLEQLLALGPALAEAQAAGSGGQVRALGDQRRSLVRAVVDQSVADADREVSPAVRAEVAATLEAGLADPGSADAVRSGRLVRALSFAGFGGVDLAGAVAQPVPSTQARRPARPEPAGQEPDHERARRRDVEAAERAAHEAAGALDDAVRRCADAERLRTSAQDAAAATRAEVQRLEDELAAARTRSAETDEGAEQAGSAAAAAVGEVEQAQQTAEQARKALDRLRRG